MFSYSFASDHNSHSSGVGYGFAFRHRSFGSHASADYFVSTQKHWITEPGFVQPGHQLWPLKRNFLKATIFFADRLPQPAWEIVDTFLVHGLLRSWLTDLIE